MSHSFAVRFVRSLSCAKLCSGLSLQFAAVAKDENNLR
jgi:hypothetical protein